MDNINENKTAEIVYKEMWDHYSELPNPAWYEYKNNNNMKKIKHLKNDYVQLDNLIYKPHTVCDLPPNFGGTDEDGYSLITEWFNYKGFTYIFDKVAKQ